MGVCQTIFHFDPQALLALPKKKKNISPSLSLLQVSIATICAAQLRVTPAWP